MSNLIELIKKSLNSMTDEQVSKVPNKALKIICDAVKIEDEEKAKRFSLWHKFGLEEADKRGLPI